jgi:hypothetical protein
VRKEARMEFRIGDAEGKGESSVGCKWPENKVRSQASVEGFNSEKHVNTCRVEGWQAECNDKVKGKVVPGLI